MKPSRSINIQRRIPFAVRKCRRMKLIPLLIPLLATLLHATPPTPTPIEPFVRIKVWGESKTCTPEFEYRIDAKEIKVYFGSNQIETRKDAISVFQDVKELQRDLRILEKQPRRCLNVRKSEMGITITYKGDVFQISREILRCKQINPKTRLKLQQIIDAVIMMDAEFEERRSETGNKSLPSNCQRP